MAASEIPPQMTNFQTFYRAAFYFFLAAKTAHFVLNFTLSAQKQHILVFRNTPNCSSVHSGMTGISLSELALHNRCERCRCTLNARMLFDSFSWTLNLHSSHDKLIWLPGKKVSHHITSQSANKTSLGLGPFHNMPNIKATMPALSCTPDFLSFSTKAADAVREGRK